MSKIKGYLFLFAFCMLLGSSIARASGTYYRPGATAVGRYTNLEKGQVRATVRADFQRYSRVRNFDGTYGEVGDVRLRTYAIQAEYGITDKSSVYMLLPFVDNDSDSADPAFAAESGIGDIRVGYNQAFGRSGDHGRFVGTVELTIPGRNYSTRKLTAPGDKSFDVLFHLALQQERLFGTGLFFHGGGGYRFRASQSPDQIVWDTEFGARIGNIVTLSTFLDAIATTHGFGLGGPGFTGDFATLGPNVTRWGVRALIALGRVDLELYYAKAIQFQNQAPFDYFGIAASGRF
jgi:hypothetical protein